MAVIPFPEPKPADEPKPAPQNGIINVPAIHLPAIIGPLLDACGDLTVGDALAELSKMPLKDFARDVFGIITGEAEQ